MKRIIAAVLACLITLAGAASADTPATPTDLCTHEYTYTYHEELPEEYTDNADGATHTVSSPSVDRLKCSLCGEELSSEAGETKTRNEKHEYKNGICVKCGYASGCAHDGQISYSILRDNVTYQDNGDDATHTWKGSGHYQEACALCGEVLRSTPFENETGIEGHVFNAIGKCYMCGAKAVCAHTSTRTAVIYGNSARYTPAGAAEHQVTGTRYQVTVCQDCGKELERADEGEVTENAPHTFSKGVCTACGYRNSCAHEHTHTEERISLAKQVVSFDQTGHTLKGIGTELTMCDDCYEIISEVSLEDVTLYEPHEYSNETCVVCGYHNTCGHPNRIQEIRFDTRRDQYAPLNEHYHTRSGPGWIDTVCADCGEHFSTEPAGNLVQNEAHVLSGGVCAICGWRAPAAKELAWVTRDGQPVKCFTAFAADEETGERVMTVTPEEIPEGEKENSVLKARIDNAVLKEAEAEQAAEIRLLRPDGAWEIRVAVPALRAELDKQPGAALEITDPEKAVTAEERAAVSEGGDPAEILGIRAELAGEDGQAIPAADENMKAIWCVRFKAE